MFKKIKFVALSITVLTILAVNANAAGRQFTTQGQLTDGTPVHMTVVAPEESKQQAEQILSSALSVIVRIDGQLFGGGGLATQINNLQKGQALRLPSYVFYMVKSATTLSAQTKGFFDIAAPSQSNAFSKRDWRRISLDRENLTISFKSSGMKLDLSKISKGYYVDIALNEIAKAGFNNAMVNVGPISRNRGHNIFTPWNIQIGFGGNAQHSKYAYRAFNYNIRNVGAATITPTGLGRNLIDGKTRNPVGDPMMKSITILANDATTATAFGLAAYAIGSKGAIKFVDRNDAIKGIMVDQQGQIVASKDLNTSSLTKESRWPVYGKASGGPNDLKQKRREEASGL
ncbi:MAG: hypothetical protein HN337_08025 [Deltaproteobacteria bacterium]|jgi:FAD:protein FMN transferase|nr:hypothetical protein [Deltaproteobacteria bacterium]